MDQQSDHKNSQNLKSDSEEGKVSSGTKQQVVEHLRSAKNVLVTVGSDPSVDELASAIGLTFMLGKLDKHATAVFSGKIPPAIEFLDPGKVFEDNVDSLRDFIIALDKEKADKLRYKVEDDVVRIFITPYKTTLSKDDFDFSQGDFNVDVVVALGVQKRNDLDKAITAHGRILHDATVITINTRLASSLGAVDWTDTNASSIAEMLMSISESFASGLVDEQIGTAYLTGIVAATNRFSNEKTSPKIMTMAAQLMAAGANQQLIATNLRREGMISESVRGKSAESTDDGELLINDSNKASVEGQSSVGDEQSNNQTRTAEDAVVGDKPVADTVGSDPSSHLAEVSPQPVDNQLAQSLAKQVTDEVQAAALDANAGTPPIPSPSLGDTQPISTTDDATIQMDKRPDQLDKPVFGGTLNATTAQAEDEKAAEKERLSKINKISLSHDKPSTDDAAHDAIEAARLEIESATSDEPFEPAHNPVVSIGSAPLSSSPQLIDDHREARPSNEPTQENMTEPEPSPVDLFMQPHNSGVKPPSEQTTVSDQSYTMGQFSPVVTASGGGGAVPPMPPLPPTPVDSSGVPPLPPPLGMLPGQPAEAGNTFSPQTTPDFMQSVGQSQNPWTEAGQDMEQRQAQQKAERQQKINKMTEQYDQAVDRNREIQGLPPVNGDHSTFPLPPTQ